MVFEMYVKTNKNNIIILYGDRHSFRCRQRNTKKKDLLKFVSFKSMMKENNKNISKVHGPFELNTISKL